ncbi:MAG: hypothetical protein D6752_06055 [Candidatus Nitrosothermus koennekii]|nr:MAG: hypothetical protein D6752_06055 [Candidatus Nitrosothermus koennekii]
MIKILISIIGTNVLMSEVLKVELPKEVVRKFKKKVMELYGYKKGSIKVAMEEMIIRFISTNKVDWNGLRGVITDKRSSVELQHDVWKDID